MCYSFAALKWPPRLGQAGRVGEDEGLYGTACTRQHRIATSVGSRKSFLRVAPGHGGDRPVNPSPVFRTNRMDEATSSSAVYSSGTLSPAPR